jgi:hypothetical protein
MSITIKAPESLNKIGNRKSVFLAGSIEMGVAEDWQSAIEQLLIKEDIAIINPRREGWDASWEQKISNVKFRNQVVWELDGLEKCDVVAMYFDENTKSPISILEFGLFARSGKMIVCCPAEFYRAANIDIVCTKYGVKQVETLQELSEAVIQALK